MNEATIAAEMLVEATNAAKRFDLRRLAAAIVDEVMVDEVIVGEVMVDEVMVDEVMVDEATMSAMALLQAPMQLSARFFLPAAQSASCSEQLCQ